MIQVRTDETNVEQPEPIQIKIDSYYQGEKAAPLLSEIGAFTTAINRGINDIAAEAFYDPEFHEHLRNRPFREPNLVQTELRGVRNGSVIIDAAVASSKFISANQAGIIQGLIATAIWAGTGHIAKHLSRAAVRLGGKLFFEETSETPKRIEPQFEDPILSDATGNSNPQSRKQERPLLYTLDNPKLRLIELTISDEKATYLAVIHYDPTPDEEDLAKPAN